MFFVFGAVRRKEKEGQREREGDKKNKDRTDRDVGLKKETMKGTMEGTVNDTKNGTIRHNTRKTPES